MLFLCTVKTKGQSANIIIMGFQAFLTLGTNVPREMTLLYWYPRVPPARNHCMDKNAIENNAHVLR